MIGSEDVKAGPFEGNDATTVFSFAGVKTFAKADLVVTKTSTLGVDSVLTLDVDYSVSLNADQEVSPGGTITYPISGSPLASGTPNEKLTIVNEPSFLQGVDLRNNTGYDAGQLEDAMDLLTILTQQAKELTGRSIKIPASDTTGLTVTLPTAANRLSKLMAFDSDGSVIATSAVDVSLVTLSDLDPTDTNATKDKILSNAQAKVWEDYKNVGHLPLAGGTMTGRLTYKTGANIASAGTCDISGATGNIIHITGVTTITAWTMTDGQIQEIIFDGILQLTHHATTNKLITSANITTAAGDRALYYYDGTIVRMIDYTRLNGAPLTAPTVASQATMEADANLTDMVTPGRMKNAPGVAKAFVKVDSTGTLATSATYNITSVTDNGVGLFTLNWATDFSGTEYNVVGMSDYQLSAVNGCVAHDKGTSRTAGSFKIASFASNTGAVTDNSNMMFVAFGDQ